MTKVYKINKDIQVQNTGAKLEDIKTNGDLIALYGNEINDINSDLQVFWTTSTASPVNSTAIQTILNRTINKGVYLFMCNLATNNWGSSGRDFPAQLWLNDSEVCGSNQVLTSACYSNYRTLSAILNVESDNSNLKMTVYSSSTASYAVTASKCYLLKLKSSDNPTSNMITSQKIDYLISLLESATYLNIRDYSTNETKIGTWINGKPIYRKVIEVTTPNNYNWTVVASISNVSAVISIEGIFKGADGRAMSVNHPENGSQLSTSFLNGNIEMRITNGASYWYSKPAFVIMEYTKTTD